MRTLLLSILLASVGGAAEVPFGAHATLRAEGNGNPAPTFQWFKDGVKVSDGATLPIPSATEKDAGTYVVFGTNGIGPGAASTPIVVTVAQAPIISGAFPNVEIRKGTTQTLVVTAYGPALVFKWQKGNSIIKGQTLPTLTIARANPSDSGAYSCTVSNQWGNVSVACKVTVK